MFGITVTVAVEDELNLHRLFLKIFLSNSLSAMHSPTPVYIHACIFDPCLFYSNLIFQIPLLFCQIPKRNEPRRRWYIPKITSQIFFSNGLSTVFQCRVDIYWRFKLPCCRIFSFNGPGGFLLCKPDDFSSSSIIIGDCQRGGWGRGDATSSCVLTGESSTAFSIENIWSGGWSDAGPNNFVGFHRGEFRGVGPRGVRQACSPSEFQAQQFLQFCPTTQYLCGYRFI